MGKKGILFWLVEFKGVALTPFQFPYILKLAYPTSSLQLTLFCNLLLAYPLQLSLFSTSASLFLPRSRPPSGFPFDQDLTTSSRQVGPKRVLGALRRMVNREMEDGSRHRKFPLLLQV